MLRRTWPADTSMILQRFLLIAALAVGGVFLTAGALPAQPPTDLIAPLQLKSGQTDTVVVSDLFFSPRYSLRFAAHPQIDLSYDSLRLRLIVKPHPALEGMTLIRFWQGSQELVIPVMVTRQQTHTFSFVPAGRPQKLTLFGSFNSWNRDNLPLTDEDGDGRYTILIPLDPGRYEYKFFIDGREVLDAENPQKVSNPFGDFNSVIDVPRLHDHQPFLHILAQRRLSSGSEFDFAYDEGISAAHPLRKEEVVALLDNQALPETAVEISGNRLSLRLAAEELRGRHTARVAVTRGGTTTPLQTLELVDGIPAGQPGSPFSWHDAVIYSLMIDRFRDGDPGNTRPVQAENLSPKTNYMGGDLQGILDKIEQGYFDSLGVNVLWISPVNQNTDKAHAEWPPPHRLFTGYHGYWPISPTKVDDRFGDMELLQSVTAAAHRHGMKVLLDLVAHHVHIDHPYYQRHRDWFGILDLPDGRKNIRFWDEYRLTTWFEPFLPSFDFQSSQAAVDTMSDNAVWWLRETGLDGFRHDAVKHVPNGFWRALTRKIRREIDEPAGRHSFQIGETFGSYELIHSYVNNGQLDAQFNFNLFFTARQVFLTPEENFSVLAHELDKTFSVYGFSNLMGNIMDSHDQVRYMAYTDGDLSLSEENSAEVGWSRPPQVDHPESYQKARLYLAYLLTIPGTPTLFYGDEIGMTGAADPDNRRMMRFGGELSADEKTMLDATRRLVAVRRQHSALRYGDFLTLHADQNSFAYLRADMNERILVVLNKSEEAQEVTLTLPRFIPLRAARDLSGNEILPIVDQQLQLTVPAVGWRFLVLQ